MTKTDLMQISQGLADLYTGLETDLIANIAAYLSRQQLDIPTAQWQIQMLAQLGALDRANISTIASYIGSVPEMLAEAMEIGALDAIRELEPGFREMVRDGLIHGTDVPVEKTMERALKTYNKQAVQSLNMVNTVMRYKAKDTARKVINDTAELAKKQSFLNMLNKAAGKAVTGMESRQAAMRQCIAEMSEKGIPAFVDKLGREWSPEAYVNMDVRTTVSNVAHQAQMDRMDDYGIDLVEVSSHSGARPKCAKDQGKIFNRSGSGGTTTDLHGKEIRYYAWSSSSYGDADGLLGINCGHQIYPFVPGVSYQTYFPEPEKENADLYNKLQKQRELERRVRKSKRECMALEKVGDQDGLQKASATLKQRQDALKQYCTDKDLPLKTDRTAVVGYNRSVSGKVNAIKNSTHNIKGDAVPIKFHTANGAPKMEKKFAQEIFDDYAKFTEQFGELPDVKGIVSMPYKNDGIFGAYNDNSGNILLFGVSGKDGKSNTARIAAEMKKKGNWSTGSPEHVLRHEMGHALQRKLKIYDPTYQDKVDKISKIRENLISSLTNLPDNDIVKEKARILSVYGFTPEESCDEFIAECIAEVANGKPRKTAKQVVEILKGGG